jgi:tetratricopeptide (TPR) repeat protein
MSVAHELRLFRIRTLQRSYRAQQSDLPLLEERISLLADVIAHYRLPGELDSDPVALAERHYDMGCALYERSKHLKTVRDLEHAEKHLRLSLIDLATGAGLFPGPHSMLGSVLQEHAYIMEDSGMAQQAVFIHRSLWSSVETAAPLLERAYHSRELGRSLRTHYYVMNDAKELLLQSIECLEHSQALYSEAGLRDHMCAFGLCHAFSSLFLAKMDRSDLDQAIGYGTLSLQICGPHHRDVYAVISKLQYLRYEYPVDPNSQMLDETLATLRDALTGAPPAWALSLTEHLTDVLELRATQRGCPEDLTEAITRTRAALTTVAPSEPSWCRLQNNVSSQLLRCFEMTGIPEDIEAAASASHLAVLHCIPGTANCFNSLNNLAGCRAMQYTAFGDLTHLDECIALLEEIVQSSPPESLYWSFAAGNMVEVLQHRYQATKSMADLDRVIGMVPLVLASVDSRVRIDPGLLHYSGNAFLSRFESTGAITDLDQAITLLQKAVEDFPTEDHTSHDRAGAYVKALHTASEVLHDGQAAAKALHLQQQIVTSLPDTHPDRARALCGLARLQLSAEANSGTMAQTLAALLDALSNHQCPAYRRLKDVYDVLSYLNVHPLEREHARQVTAIYSAAIALLPEVASFGLNATARLAVMTNAGSLTTWGATHAIFIGQLDVALEMLEAGRSVFWTQNLHLRTSFMDLPATMADRLTKIAYTLARPMPDGVDVQRRDRELARRRQAGEEFRSMLDEARLIPGFECLLRNASFTSIAQAATRHPIVVFVADENSGHAIIVQSEVYCHLVRLPSATAITLQNLSNRLGRHSKHARSSRGVRRVHVENDHSDDVYRELWTLIMRPVVEALQWPVSLYLSR